MTRKRPITVELTPHEAAALAQLAKRLRWEHLLACATDAAQADAIHDALEHVRVALADTSRGLR